MKQDLRDLFKMEEENVKPLPDTHRTEFIQKLNATKSSKVDKTIFYKVAASLVLFLAIGYLMVNTLNVKDKHVSSLELQIEQVETQYLSNIEIEWERFLKLTKDEKLIQRYKQKLESLDKEYQDVSKSFKANTNNILIIESLVENLQTRLQLLKNIQAHIKLLNQKTNDYETTI